MLYVLLAAVLVTLGLAAFFYARSRILASRLADAYAECAQLRHTMATAGKVHTTKEIYPGRYPATVRSYGGTISPSPLVRLQYVSGEGSLPPSP